MRFIYPAIIKKISDDEYHAMCPDLEGCSARGYSHDDVMEEINLVLRNWISLELEEDEPFIPPASDIEDLTASANDGEVIRNVCVTIRITEGWDE